MVGKYCCCSLFGAGAYAGSWFLKEVLLIKPIDNYPGIYDKALG